MDVFYSTLATICFALVGLWWVVVQFRYDWCIAVPARRMTAYVALIHFVAPGLLSLIAVLSTQEATIWRLGTAIGGLLGVVTCVLSMRFAFLNHQQRLQEWVLLILFLVVFGLTFLAIPVFGLKPIVVSALLNIAIIGMSVQFAWSFFITAQAEMKS